MTALEKIAESEYNLHKLRHIPAINLEFKYELSSFLTSSQSIFSHLLQDFSVKYNLKLSQISYTSFLKQARKTKNNQAMKFIEWQNIEFNKIKSDNRFGFLITKRNTDVHQQSVMPKKFTLWTGPHTISANTTVEIPINFDTALVSFPENTKQDVRQICGLFLYSIKKMVEESHSRF